MASIYDIAGTSCQSFTIGNGVTIFYGQKTPHNNAGKVGDIYVQTHLTIETDMDDGSTLVEKKLFGRVYIKTIKNNIETWEYIKNYTFDTPIITEIESELNSNEFLISIQNANNQNISSADKDTDFNINHSAYGVTRYATDSEVLINSVNDLATPSNKTISMTPSQIAKNLKVESDRAIGVEGKLTEINTALSNKNLVSAINDEYSQRIAKDSNLQSQIDAINAKKDVVDIVPSYQALTEYDTSILTDLDIIKVLLDESEQGKDRQSYYKWVLSSRTFEYIGSESASYTKAEADNKFVENETDEIISGTKTFTKTIISQKDGEILDIQNSNGVSISSITSSSSDAGNYISLSVADDNAVEVASIDVVYDKAENKAYVTVPLGETTNNTISTIVASQGWVNDPTLSTNVVHRSGDETINGTKTFTTSPNVPTATTGDNTTKAASTAFVQTELLGKEDKIVITDSDHNKVYATNENGETYWRTVQDITTLEGLVDVNVDTQNKEDGQTIIFDSSSNKWVNGLQTVATIKYW